MDLVYGYDPEGLRTKTENGVAPDHSEAYGHDNRQRLTELRRGTLSTSEDGAPTVADEDLLVHDRLKAMKQWVALDRRGNWLDYRELRRPDAETTDARIEMRDGNDVNEYVTINPNVADMDNPWADLNSVFYPSHDANGNLTFDPLAKSAWAFAPCDPISGIQIPVECRTKGKGKRRSRKYINVSKVRRHRHHHQKIRQRDRNQQ